MYKKGINLNTVTVETLKTLPGIGDNLARSLALHRELKSEFVNPSEFSAIVPEHVYSGIVKDYNIYAVSPHVWKSRVTSEINKLYSPDLTVFFSENSSLTVSLNRDIYVINIPAGIKLERDVLHETGAIAGLKRLMGWRPKIKALVLTGSPDMDTLNRFLARYDAASLFCAREDDMLSAGSKQKFITKMIMAQKIKVFSSAAKIKSDDFEIKMFAPSGDSPGRAILIAFGAVSVLLMFNMAEADQMALIHDPAARGLIPNAVCAYGAAPVGIFMSFCSSPELIDIRKKKKLISDGNLIYAS